MKVEKEKMEDGTIKLKISHSEAEVNKSLNDIAKAVAPRTTVNGFREGMAPLEVVLSTYGKQIRLEASSRLLHEGTSEALKDKDLRNISNPILLEEYRQTNEKPHLGRFHLDGSFSYEITVEPPPDFDVKDYKEVSVESGAKTREEWVQKQLMDQQKMYGKSEVVTRPVQSGDELTVDFEGLVDGDVKFEGGSEEGYHLLVGEGDFIKELEDSFIGHLPDDEFTTTVDFPATYFLKEVAGKTAIFTCKLHEIRELVPHELNDELAALLSYESVDEMTKSYDTLWDTQMAGSARAKLFSSIMDKIVVSNPFTVPTAWIESEIQNTVRRLSLDAEDAKVAAQSIAEMSERTVRVAYILDKIYEKESDIHLTAEALQKIFEEEAVKNGLDGGEAVIENLKGSGQYEGFITFYEQQAVIDFLIESAIIEGGE